ncbi:MAG TPA: Pycsar system effector family protein [Pyrinomonadaceae bacterium]|jgi:hypothetical protein
MAKIDPKLMESQTASTKEERFQFLMAQIDYATTHLQIADTKAAGVIAYISLLTSYTVSKLDLLKNTGVNWKWVALTSLGVGGIAIVTALLVILPRARPGNIPDDTFSWQGIARASKSTAYITRIAQLKTEEMELALADTMEAVSFVLNRKYSLVRLALITALLSSIGQAVFWLLN